MKNNFMTFVVVARFQADGDTVHISRKVDVLVKPDASPEKVAGAIKTEVRKDPRDWMKKVIERDRGEVSVSCGLIGGPI